MSLRNDCSFRGNLTRDPEVRQTQSGKSVANFSLAVNGYKKDDVTFVDFEVWEKTAEFLIDNVVKGDQVEVRSEYKLDVWTDKDGETRKTPRFRVLELDAIKLKKWSNGPTQADEDDDDDEEDEAPKKKATKPAKKSKAAPPPEDDHDDDDDDDDDDNEDDADGLKSTTKTKKKIQF